MGVTSIEYNLDHKEIEKLLRTVDRPGDYFVHGKLVAPMPRLEVALAGIISFPVPDVHARSLIRVAERAPYGRGTETVLDTSVRDCWQIDSSKVQVGGAGWDDTFALIVKEAAAGLGCPSDRLSARLYKLLVYEQGGFFAEHRDSEKADGMVATLVISLPAAGAGGELVVRHNGREAVIDMRVSDPSELAYAAFYADCTHEIRPLRRGHRVALVYNLMVRGKRSFSMARAPVFSMQADAIAERLADWSRPGGTTEKIVWVLDHDYSEAGLSFATLKGMDHAVGRVLLHAASQAGCIVHAAVLHIEESGGVYDNYYDDLEECEIDEVYEWSCWLDTWRAADGASPSFGRVPARDGEVLPSGALDDAEPDEKRVHEASGNEGVSIDQSYRSAALVIWPRAKTVAVLARGDIDGAIRYVDQQIRIAANPDDAAANLVSRLIDDWPADARHGSNKAVGSRSKMLRLLVSVSNEAQASRFLDEVVLPRYQGRENEDLIVVGEKFGPRAMRDFLPKLVEAKCARHLESLVDLTLRLRKSVGREHRQAWLDLLEGAAVTVIGSLPQVLEKANKPSGYWGQPRQQTLDTKLISRILWLGWHFGLDTQTSGAARLLVQNPSVATPDRALPEALAKLQRTNADCSGKQAFWSLWQHAARFLLARSAARPSPPSDWLVDARIDCTCEPCRLLQVFCLDRRSSSRTFAMRQELRSHLESKIRQLDLPMDCETIARGRPYKLVCTKNQADYRRRLKEYADDVDHMRKLEHAPPAKHATGQAGRLMQELQAARRRSGAN